MRDRLGELCAETTELGEIVLRERLEEHCVEIEMENCSERNLGEHCTEREIGETL